VVDWWGSWRGPRPRGEAGAVGPADGVARFDTLTGGFLIRPTLLCRLIVTFPFSFPSLFFYPFQSRERGVWVCGRHVQRCEARLSVGDRGQAGSVHTCGSVESWVGLGGLWPGSLPIGKRRN
jgi:hypothetical protein